jgi:hypothetical protein
MRQRHHEWTALSPSTDQQIAAQYAMERKQAFMSGRAKIPNFWQSALAELDPLLAARWDIDQDCIVVDIWIEQWGYWQTVMVCREPDGSPMRTGEQCLRRVLDTLYRSNTQKLYSNSGEMLRAKREQGDATKKIKEGERTEAMLAAVDKLSNKSVGQFIDAHRAIHTGEKIVAHGADEKTLETFASASAKAPAVPTGKAFNAGMHPMIHKRTQREKNTGKVVE